MKKILIVNNKYKLLGGEDSNIIDEIYLLDKEYKVDYLEFDNSSKISIFDLLAFFTNSNFNSNKIFKEKIEIFKPDIVYIHNLWFKANLGIFKILKKHNAKVLVKVHNFRYVCASSYFLSKHLLSNDVCHACNLSKKSSFIFNKYYSDSLLKSFFLIKYMKKLTKIFQKQDLKVLSITKFHKQNLLKAGIPQNKIIQYSNPIQKIHFNSRNNSNKLDYFIYAGRVSEEKGLRELLEVWTNLNLNNVVLRIFGDGPLKKDLKSKYNKKNIVFEGTVSNSYVLESIANSKAVITATKMFEGQPRLLCEASMLGIPSVFPLFGGMSEFFPDDYAYSFNQFDYLDLSQKIKNIFDDDLYNEEKKRIKQFSSSKLSNQKLLDLFSDIVN